MFSITPQQINDMRNRSRMLSSDSQAPFGDPGRFTITHLPRVPAKPRDKTALRVFRIPSKRIHSPNARDLTV